MRPRLGRGEAARGKGVMVRFYELSCLAKSVYFILQETVLWFSYFICGIGGEGVGKVFVCVRVLCVSTRAFVSVCLCVCKSAFSLYVY